MPNIPGCGAKSELCTDKRIPSNDPPSFRELPTSTPLTEGSTQDVFPQVNLNPTLDEPNEFPVLAKDVTNKYPQRSNRGVLKKQYEPDPKAKTRYPISNYVSPHRLFESYAFSVNQLSTVSISSNV